MSNFELLSRVHWFNRTTALCILVIIAGLTVFFGYGLTRSGFDYDFEKFFPPHDEDTRLYEGFRKEFESDYDFLFIGLTSKQGIYNTEFLQKVNTLTDTLSRLPFVKEVHSLTHLRMPVISLGGITKRPVLHFDNDSLLKIDSVRLNETGEFTGSFISKDQHTLCIFLQTREQMAKKPSDTLIARIEKIVNGAGFDEVHMAGKIKAQQVYLARMQKEVLLFLGIAIVLVFIFLVATFRSFQGVFIPLAVVLLSIVWQLGLMHFLGKKIDILTMLVPTILFIVGMSDVIHIMSKYIEETRNGLDKKSVIIKTVREVGFATFLTSVTTAIGFVTLITSSVSPIREFGIYTALGVLIAYLLSITILPAVFLLMPVPAIVNNDKYDRQWNTYLHRQLRRILAHPKKIVVFSVLIILVTGAGMYRLKVNNLLLEDLNENEPLKKEFRFFEKQFSGGRPFEMLVEVKDKNTTLLDFEVLKEIEALETHARNTFGLGFVKSPVTLIKIFNRSVNSGLNAYYKLPATKEEYESLKKQMVLYGMLNNAEVQKVISKDLKKFRVSGKLDDVGSYKANRMEKEFIATLPVLSHTQYTLTGSARLIDKNISYLSVNLMQGLGSAILIVAICFGLLYRSFKTIIIALIPNIIPMICIAGIMGFTGIDIKFSTSIIFTIAFGIAVDDTIHFLSRYKIERQKGLSNIYAIKRSYLSTGKAMILTSLVLCAGFVTMISSSFMSIFYVGLLLSLTLLIALLADLYLLPIMLMGYRKKKKNKTGK